MAATANRMTGYFISYDVIIVGLSSNETQDQ
jgi:hypothetical protein